MEKTWRDELVTGLLEDVAGHAGQGALFFDRAGGRIRTAGALPPFCRWCLNDAGLAERCRTVYDAATENAMSSAEPFYYTCWAGLLFAAMAIAPLARCRGCVAIGGFRAAGDTWGDHAGADETKKCSRRFDPAALFAAAPVVTSTRLRHLGTYLQDAGFAAGLNSAAYFRRRHAVCLEQRAIAEHARRISPARLSGSALARRADMLVARLPGLNEERLREQAARWLAAVLQVCVWDLTRLKAHLRVPLALITRDALLRGDDWSIAVKNELRFTARLDQAPTVEDVCHVFVQILTDAAGRVGHPAGAKLPVTERVIRWLEENYSQPATLAAAARAVGASASAIIKQVRRDAGKTFHDLLLETRVAEAKRLLATTRLEISAIAQQCGFFDQSHFTRHFQRAINLTPGCFRKLMNFSEADI